jgi:subtilase family serine protease
MSMGKVWRLNRVALFALLALGTLAGVQAAPPPADAAPSGVRPVALAASPAPRLPAAATRVGAMAATQPVHLTVSLKIRDPAGLNALLAGLADPKSPYYHHYLPKGQFGPMFGPTPDQVAAVEVALKAAGLSPGPVSADRLRIPVTATAAQVERAFGTPLVNYRLPGGRVAYANAAAPTIAASVAPLVSGISGLDDVNVPHPASLHRAPPAGPASRFRRPAVPKAAALAASVARPRPCAAASDASALTMDFWADYYGMSPLYDLGDLGQGQRIALLELEPNLPSDVSAFESCFGISTPVNYIPVDGGLPSGPGAVGEAAMDIEILAGLAPQARIDVYQAPDTMNDLDDIMARFVGDDTDKTLSISWALCELLTPPVNRTDEANLAVEAAAQGQTILAASGDDGVDGCGPVQVSATVDSPALAPYVVSVGGTELNAVAGEHVWNNSSGASGGGISGDTCMPAYQYQPAIPGMFDGVTDKTSSLCVSSATPQGYVREVPDISANGSTLTPYTTYFNGSWTTGAGTSASTPLWAAIAALTNASPFCDAYGSGNPGVLPMALYAMTAANQAIIYGGTSPQILGDITSGDNNWALASNPGGGYQAARGYDMASGLGVPMVSGIGAHGAFDNAFPGFAAAMCRQTATRSRSWAVTGVGPSSGKAGLPITVTISGTGFLPIPGAQQVRITSGATVLATLIPSSCTTTTCTVTLPAEPAGTVVDVRVSVLNAGYSAGSAADKYTYTTAPLISGISPAQGTAAGGNTVVIGGVNLAGARSVTFGGKPGTGIIAGDSRLTVTAPAGSAGTTVPVVVTGPGGTSNSVSYQYVATPHITAISPASGTANGGTSVTITGSDFVGVKSVTFGGKVGFSIAVSGSSSLTVIAPFGTAGMTVPVVVTGAGGTSNPALYLYT